jgi:catechol 2,3-dioxygenase-like lactoylglutathione lyase family enzyme
MDFKITDVCFFVSDVERSIRFYQGIIGLNIKRQDIGFAEFQTGEATFAVWELSDIRKNLGENIISNEGHRCIGAFQFDTGEEVTTFYNELRAKKVEFATDLVDWPWGARAAYFKDPDGFLWEIYAWVEKPYTW